MRTLTRTFLLGIIGIVLLSYASPLWVWHAQQPGAATLVVSGLVLTVALALAAAGKVRH